MNFKTTLALLALLIGVGLYVYFVERHAPIPDLTGQQTADAPGQPLLPEDAPAATDVRQITLQREGRRVVLQRQDQNWRQVAPVRFDLQASALDQLARTATSLRYGDRFEPAPDDDQEQDGRLPSLSAVGLAPAQVVLTLEGDGDQPAQTIRLGSRSLAGRAYAMVNDDPHVYIVDDKLHRELFENDLNDWRQRSLTGPRASRTQRVVLQRNGRTIELRKTDSRWFLDAANTQRASQEQVEALARTVQGMPIASFITDTPEDLGRFGLEQPQLMLRLEVALPSTPAAVGNDTGGDQAQGTPATQPAEDQVQAYTLRIGAPADFENNEFFATWSVGHEPSSVVFTLSDEKLEPLRLTANDLRDPRVTPVQANEIREVRITREQAPTLHLRRDTDRGFVFASNDPGYGVDYDTATRLLETIVNAKAQGYEADFQPASEPIATVTMTLRGSDRSDLIQLYAENGPMYLAVRQGEPVAYRVPAEDLAPLFQPRIAFRDRDLLNIPAEQIARVELQGSQLGAGYTFQRQSGTGQADAPANTQPASQPGVWQLTGHDAFEREAFTALLGELRRLRVARWLETTDPLGEAPLQVVLHRRDGEPVRLSVAPATRHATMTGIDAMFVVSESLTEALIAEYRDRRVLPVALEQIERVTLEQPGGEVASLTVRRDSQGQYRANRPGGAGSEAALKTAAAAQLFDTLTGLRVKRYVAGPASLDYPPQRTLVIHTTDDKTYTLGLFGEKNAEPAGDEGAAETLVHLEPVAHEHQQWFTLDDATLKTLRAELVQQEGTPTQASR